jgi:hypothetical protein
LEASPTGEVIVHVAPCYTDPIKVIAVGFASNSQRVAWRSEAAKPRRLARFTIGVAPADFSTTPPLASPLASDGEYILVVTGKSFSSTPC